MWGCGCEALQALGSLAVEFAEPSFQEMPSKGVKAGPFKAVCLRFEASLEQWRDPYSQLDAIALPIATPLALSFGHVGNHSMYRATGTGSTMIDAYATLPHYWTHIRPVWDALPPERRGTLYLGPRTGVVNPPGQRQPVGPGPLTLVASWTDLDWLRFQKRRAVLMEHGAGQSYSDRHAAFAGGFERETVDLFLCPGPHSAMRNAQVYPDKPVAQVGSPALDRYLNGWRPTLDGTVAVTWHHNLGKTHWDELQSAYPRFIGVLPDCARCFPMIGHGHPRSETYYRRQYRRLGIRWAEWAEVMDRASVLVVDNSSTGFEFAATGRPVVWCNSPYYRRDVEHGLRFWGNVGVGYQCDEPSRLVEAVEEALSEPAWKIEERLSLTPYSHLDGRAAERAAEAIVSVLEESEAA